MVNKITDPKILKAIATVRDADVKKVLLESTGSNVEFVMEHEKAFRALIPDWFDKFRDEYCGGFLDEYNTYYMSLDAFRVFLCLQTGAVDVNDFRTATQFRAAGITMYDLNDMPSAKELFLPSIEKRGEHKALTEFLDKNAPELLNYFLPMLCDVENPDFKQAINGYIKSAGMQDSLRIKVFENLFNSSNVKILLSFLDDIENNDYYRYKALNEAAVLYCRYMMSLPPKELVKVLRDAANGNTQKYFDADFRHAYYFINAYDKLYEARFRPFALDLLKHGGDRARWALLYSLSSESLNGEYAMDIFSRDCTLDDLSFCMYRFNAARMSADVLPAAFECLFAVLSRMDKVNYHFKTDDDIKFARDVSKSMLVHELGNIASRLDDNEYISRLDGIYDGLKEEAQATYLMHIGNKTTLDVRACAIKFLKTDEYRSIKFYDEQKIKLTYGEAVGVSDYLKSKKQEVKSKIIKEFLRSDDRNKIAEYLCGQSEEYKRQAGEEMLESKGKVSKSKLDKPEDRCEWDNKSVFEIKVPKKEIEKIASQKFDYAPVKPMSYKRFEAFAKNIEQFIKDNADYEYETNYGDGKVTFGTTFTMLKRDGSSPRNGFSCYPLGDELKKLYADLTEDDIAYLSIIHLCERNNNRKLLFALFDKSDAKKICEYLQKGDDDYRIGTSVRRILFELDDAATEEFLSERTLCKAVYMFADEKCIKKMEVNDVEWYDTSYTTPDMFIHRLCCSDDKEVIRLVLSVECRLVSAGVEDGVSYQALERAYEHGYISRELTRYFLLKEGGFSHVFNPKYRSSYILRDDYEYPKFKKCLTEFLADALDAEFKRGNLQTPYSSLISRTPALGINNYMRAITGLRGLTWERSPYGGCEKNEVFSSVLKSLKADKGDSAELFKKLAKEYCVTDDELIRATLFNPVYVDYTAEYLGIPHLKLAVYWFVAHLNETLYGDEKDAREQKLKEFSDISYPDFQDGAFDSVWYAEMTDKVPEDVLKRIYANAKYVTVGGLHKRAQRFFDAVGGRIQKEECVQKITASRNKDYCLIYSLIPIENKADLYERYVFLAEFSRGSKQFGAQRQMSERRTVDIALQNLARAAGYASVDIFMFEMEAEHPSDLFKPYTIDDITVTPYIDERRYKVAQTVEKAGKTLSSLPQKYAKHKIAAELREQVKELNRKLRRIIDSFENSMNTRVPFTEEQLKSMSREPVIKTVLGKLLLLADGKLCVFDGELKSVGGERVCASEIFVAHPAELKSKGLLPAAVEYIARNNVKQPFKQALREIYVKTEAELGQEEVLRFKGFNVDVRKCVAALKGKGWGVSEDIGLRKVHYRADVISAIFRECDFLYSVDYDNEDRELHGILFLNRKNGDIIPLKDVDDITFSETLRDVDLMISISSKSVYDFELAMSTVEVRHAVLNSMIDILRLDNVSLLKDNIKVVGTRGTYTVNIRTGLVFKEGTGCLALDTVYSTDKPLLLDFADEDPMTADIISKAVVLADDGKIKDPAILREIER